MSNWHLDQRFEFDGDIVAWHAEGEGPPVVLVHGFPGNSWSWRQVVPRLARYARVYVYDMPGFGASAPQPGPEVVSARAQAHWLARLIEHWRLEGPAVVAHDIGSAVALGALLFHGCAFRRLALIDAATLNPCVSRNSIHVRRHLEAYRTMPVMLYEQILRAHIPTVMASPMPAEVFEAYFAPWRGEAGQAAYLRFLAQFDETFLDEIRWKLGTVNVPVRVLWGEADTWIPVAHGERLARLLPDATLRVIPAAGHFAMEDQPEAIIGELTDFLTSGA